MSLRKSNAQISNEVLGSVSATISENRADLFRALRSLRAARPRSQQEPSTDAANMPIFGSAVLRSTCSNYFCPGIGGNFLNIFVSALASFVWFFSGLSLSVSLAVPRQIKSLFLTSAMSTIN